MVTIVKLKGSVEGVIIAAAISIITKACRLYFLKNFAFTIPILANIITQQRHLKKHTNADCSINKVFKKVRERRLISIKGLR